MHTSTRMRAGDFRFVQHNTAEEVQVEFRVFCPDYHELDRIGIVSPGLEDGVLHASHALLALTTAFYDRLRARRDEFFDYPQHFAFVGTDGKGVRTTQGQLLVNTPELWDAWSWLDVWPAAKWVTAPANAYAMLQRIHDYQINRLFWPYTLKPGPDEPQPPEYVWSMLRTSLKAVYLYGDGDQAFTAHGRARLEICIAPAVADVVHESLTRLPAVVAVNPNRHESLSQVYTMMDVEDFLRMMQDDD